MFTINRFYRNFSSETASKQSVSYTAASTLAKHFVAAVNG